MNKFQVFSKRYSSKILTITSTLGVIGTTVLAVKATPKALTLIEEKKYELDVEKLTVADTIKAAWKPYIPAVLTGTATIACIFGIDFLSTKNQASLMSAYVALDRTFKEYKNKVKELYGEEAIEEIKHELIESNYDKDMIVHENKELFLDFNSLQYFESTMEEVKRAEAIFNQNFKLHGYACLNDYCDALGLPHAKYGDQIGWSYSNVDLLYAYDGIEFTYEKTAINDDLECWVISLPVEPSFDYIIY